MPIEATIHWTVRTNCIADDGREFPNMINGAMDWLTAQPWFMDAAFSREGLSHQQCLDLWKWIGRSDPPPKQLRILVNAEDIQRLFPPPPIYSGENEP